MCKFVWCKFVVCLALVAICSTANAQVFRGRFSGWRSGSYATTRQTTRQVQSRPVPHAQELTELSSEEKELQVEREKKRQEEAFRWLGDKVRQTVVPPPVQQAVVPTDVKAKAADTKVKTNHKSDSKPVRGQVLTVDEYYKIQEAKKGETVSAPPQ